VPRVSDGYSDHDERQEVKQLLLLGRSLLSSGRDLAPIIGVVIFFQLFVLQRPFPDVVSLALGLLYVLVGLNLFVRGLEIGLFPLGEAMAYGFASKGSLFWLLLFSFLLGFGTTLAEPALIAVASKAAEVATQAGVVDNERAAKALYALGLRYTVAVAVGVALVLGVVRILKGWPVHYLFISGYIVVVIMTAFAPREIVGIAYDAGGVTTSTITVPLVAALGIGLASSIKGRNPLIDGFGLIALASLSPMAFVMIYGMATR
jgi:hypothetical protein